MEANDIYRWIRFSFSLRMEFTDLSVVMSIGIHWYNSETWNVSEISIEVNESITGRLLSKISAAPSPLFSRISLKNDISHNLNIQIRRACWRAQLLLVHKHFQKDFCLHWRNFIEVMHVPEAATPLAETRRYMWYAKALDWKGQADHLTHVSPCVILQEVFLIY